MGNHPSKTKKTMKRNIFVLVAVFAVAMLTACTKEEISIQLNENQHGQIYADAVGTGYADISYTGSDEILDVQKIDNIVTDSVDGFGWCISFVSNGRVIAKAHICTTNSHIETEAPNVYSVQASITIKPNTTLFPRILSNVEYCGSTKCRINCNNVDMLRAFFEIRGNDNLNYMICINYEINK